MKLPDVYIQFYKRARRKVPPSFIGSDIFNDRFDLKEAAIKLLRENEVENFLSDDDFLFMMHQGYIFYYFKADGNPNPDVLGFTEVGNERRNFGPIADFLGDDRAYHRPAKSFQILNQLPNLDTRLRQAFSVTSKPNKCKQYFLK